MAVVTSVDLYVFGKRSGPRRPRPFADLPVDTLGMVGPEVPPLPKGSSLFADPFQAPLHGHFLCLPKGTILPDDLGIIADGCDVFQTSKHGPTHHTIYPITQMTMKRFTELFLGLPWRYVGRKK